MAVRTPRSSRRRSKPAPLVHRDRVVDRVALPLIIGGFFLWIRMRQTSGTGAPAAPAAQLGAIGASQAVMGNHLVAKVPGDFIQIVVDWNALTINSQSAPIPWNYRLRYMLGRSVGGVWTVTAETSGNETNASYGPKQSSAGLITPNAVNNFFDVRVELYTADSDQNGSPTGTFTLRATGEHPQAVSVVSGASQPFGGVGNIGVSNLVSYRRS